MPTVVKLTPEDLIPLPSEVKNRLGVRSGDRLEFVLGQDGSIGLRPVGESFKKLRGLGKRPWHKPASVEEMNQGIAEYVEEDDERIRSGR